MFGIGFQEMIIILVVVLIFFGPKRLPDLARSIGKGVAEFKKASDEIKRGIDDAVREETAKAGEPADADASAKAETPAPMPEPGTKIVIPPSIDAKNALAAAPPSPPGDSPSPAPLDKG